MYPCIKHLKQCEGQRSHHHAPHLGHNSTRVEADLGPRVPFPNASANEPMILILTTTIRTLLHPICASGKPNNSPVLDCRQQCRCTADELRSVTTQSGNTNRSVTWFGFSRTVGSAPSLKCSYLITVSESIAFITMVRTHGRS